MRVEQIGVLPASALRNNAHGAVQYFAVQTPPLYQAAPIAFSGLRSQSVFWGLFLGVVTALGLAAPSQAQEASVVSAQKKESPPRIYYFLHSGINDPDLNAARCLADWLQNTAHVPPNQVVVLKTPYKSLGVRDFIPWGPKQNIGTYKDSTLPNSPTSKAMLKVVMDEIAARGIRPCDTIKWVGHSAGGQAGITVAGQFAEMSSKVALPQITDVITLGSPLATNHAAPKTTIHVCVSPGDCWCRAISVAPSYAHGKRIKSIPPNPHGAVQVHSIPKVGHTQWYRNDEVRTLLLSERISLVPISKK